MPFPNASSQPASQPAPLPRQFLNKFRCTKLETGDHMTPPAAPLGPPQTPPLSKSIVTLSRGGRVPRRVPKDARREAHGASPASFWSLPHGRHFSALRNEKKGPAEVVLVVYLPPCRQLQYCPGGVMVGQVHPREVSNICGRRGYFWFYSPAGDGFEKLLESVGLCVHCPLSKDPSRTPPAK